jgi:pyruvate, water dikinase
LDMESAPTSSGLGPLDDVLQGLRLGDNVVWQVDQLDDYGFFAEAFAQWAISKGRRLVYVRFGSHPCSTRVWNGAPGR